MNHNTNQIGERVLSFQTFVRGFLMPASPLRIMKHGGLPSLCVVARLVASDHSRAVWLVHSPARASNTTPDWCRAYPALLVVPALLPVGQL